MTNAWAEPTLRRRQVIFDVVVGVVFGLLMAPLHITQGTRAVIACVLLGLALCVRRVSWQLMSALAFAAAVIQLFGPDIAFLANFAYGACFFVLGSNPRARVRHFGLAAAVVAVVVASLYGGLVGAYSGSTSNGWLTALGIGSSCAVIVFGGWVWGFLRWQSRQTLRAQVDAQIEAVERRRVTELYDIEQERRRIAADMHDVVAHSWAVVAAQSDGARYALRDSPAGAERALEVIGETARAAITDLRTIVAQLRDPALQPSTPGHEQQAEVIGRMKASGMDLTVTEVGTRDESPLLALTAHRLLGEALTNALKHGDLDRPVRAEIDWSDGYRLTVTNHLSDRAAATAPSGHGIVGMAERAHVAGGAFSAGRESDVWVARAHIPATAIVEPGPGGRR